ncbi:MAG: hypothetical protein V1653_03450, partial [bacterium]
IGPLSELKPIEFHQVRRTPLERLSQGLIEQHHYLGYSRPVGEHLEYMALPLSIDCTTGSRTGVFPLIIT